MKILTESTALALWHRALQEAQSEAHIRLQAKIESYVVSLLMHYMTFYQLAQQVMAIRFLQHTHLPLKVRNSVLQDIGDQCLLITGLFPGMAEKRRVTLNYYIEMGQIAYDILSQQKHDIFSDLSHQFITVSDVLRSVRPITLEQLPLEIRKLWDIHKE